MHAKAVTLDFARDNIPEVDIREMASEAWQLTLKATVLGTGWTAKVAETTAVVSRRVQAAAAGALKLTSTSVK
ncbi:MAG: hypothetical protein CVT67_02835 [Actinobacteria bacterium HGW-Actinobacteria-7]|nr:MAG: hypothetical protein CVT67_02835 [Actinobacteria bacterium HGW-Actinobacteria-7]